jgi:hypothetical protein
LKKVLGVEECRVPNLPSKVSKIFMFAMGCYADMLNRQPAVTQAIIEVTTILGEVQKEAGTLRGPWGWDVVD